MRGHDAATGSRGGEHWVVSVVAGTSATAAAAALLDGFAGLLVALVALAATVSAELLGIVRSRAERLRDDLVRRLRDVGAERIDETIDARSHDPFAYVGRLLGEYRPAAMAAAATLDELRARIDDVDRRLSRTRAARAMGDRRPARAHRWPCG